MIRQFTLLFLFTSVVSLALPYRVLSQEELPGDEVFLFFRYEGVVNAYISSIYADDRFYLSVNEIFNSLNIDHQSDVASYTMSGQYLDEGRYHIDFINRLITYKGEEYRFTADDGLVTEFGYYLSTDLFLNVFDLDFTVSFSNLSIELRTDYLMPIVAQRERERARARMLRTQREIDYTFYPLIDSREETLLRLGFLDYNITGNYSRERLNMNSTGRVGANILGGDLQGAIFSNISSTSRTLRTDNFRWTYGIPENRYISTITAGQFTAGRLSTNSVTGARLTNRPIEPRRIFFHNQITGTTFPNAEVEIYRNNSLYDFYQTDESGRYSFQMPITYGTSTISTRIYGPTGQYEEESIRLQIPVDYLRPGEINYTLEGGRLDNPVAGSIDRGLMGRGSVSTGINPWLTVTGGAEYFDDFHDELPTFFGSLSGRVFRRYLFNVDAAHEAFYRFGGRVIYANAMSASFDYTHFIAEGGLYNRSANLSQMRTSLFTPFRIGSLPLFFRWSFNWDQRVDSEVYRYRIDLNSRIGRGSIRIGYIDSQVSRLDWMMSPNARVNASYAYNFSRSRNVTSLLRGAYIRSQLTYFPSRDQIDNAEIQVSRSFAGTGRFSLTFGHSFVTNFNYFRFNLSLNLNRLRTNSSVNRNRGNVTVNQSIRGSIGMDPINRNVILTNRQQVGRAGIAARLFVDNNNSGSYDNGDDLIEQLAIRVERAGSMAYLVDGVNYVSQLQPYRRYNVLVNKGAVNNPLLIPEVERFSFIANPNYYQVIDIPFYLSGIIEGMVLVEREGEFQGLGGLRLHLLQTNVTEGVAAHTQELRTFSDGSFYGFEIPPGDYRLTVDPAQLEFLNSRMDEVLEFSVRGLAEGDLVEGMEIRLLPRSDTDIPPDDQEIAERLEEILDDQDLQEFRDIFDEEAEIEPEVEIIEEEIVGEGVEPEAEDEYQSGAELLRGNEFCKSSIIFGENGSLQLSLNLANRLERDLGLNFEIAYQPYEDLFYVITEAIDSAEQLYPMTERFVREEDDQVRLISICNDTQELQTLNYFIQLAALSVEENAISFVNRLEDEYGIEAEIAQAGDQIYRVRTKSLQSRSEMESTFGRIRSLGIAEGSFLIPDPSSYIPNRFNYVLELARGYEIEEVIDLLNDIEEISEERVVITMRNGDFYLYLETLFSDQSDATQMYEYYERLDTRFRPAIHFMQEGTEGFLWLERNRD